MHLPTRAASVLALLAALSITACNGDSGPSQVPRFNTSGTPLPTAPAGVGLETPSAFVTAPPAPGATTVALTPKTYQDPADPCYGLSSTVTLLAAPPACQTNWQQINVTKVPGEDITNAFPTPRTAQVAAGFDLTKGSADALAFYRYEVLSTFLVLNDDTAAMQIMDTAAYKDNDRILGIEDKEAGTAINIPACAEPTSIRVVPVTPDVTMYIHSLGWPAPSNVAILADFPACKGITFEFKGGVTKAYFGNAAAATTVFTGQPENIAPFGTVWVIDGYGVCGVPGLKPVCGV